MWSVVGHPAVLTALDRALASGRPAHAYLFAGPEGVGKTTTALEFAAALNCSSPGAPPLEDGTEGAPLGISTPPCGECRPCRDTLAGRHPDVERVAPGGLCDEPDHREHADSRDLRI